MRQHVDLLRRHALGDFRSLLQEVARDPAMLLWLDADTNRKARPNDHFARELFDSFTLGAEQCSANDIADAARSFTGWFVMHDEFRLVEHEHDPGAKQILGREGNWNGEDVVRIALEQPRTAGFLVRKLYRWLISETDEPSDDLLAPLATAFAKDYDISKLVEQMLRSNLFFSPAAYRQRIKSPVEFALGIVKGLEELGPTAPLGARPGCAWGRTSTSRRAIAAGPAGGRGSTRPRCWAAETWRWPCWPDRADTATKSIRWPWRGSTAIPSPRPIAGFFVDLFLQGDVEATVTESLVRTARRSWACTAENELVGVGSAGGPLGRRPARVPIGLRARIMALTSARLSENDGPHGRTSRAGREFGGASVLRSACGGRGRPAPARKIRMLVVVQLAGGNDGLNTIVPMPTTTTAGLAKRFGLSPASCTRSMTNWVSIRPCRPHGSFTRMGSGRCARRRLSESRSVAPPGDADLADGRPAIRPIAQTGWLGRGVERLPRREETDTAAVFVGHINQPFTLNAEQAVVSDAALTGGLHAFRLSAAARARPAHAAADG